MKRKNKPRSVSIRHLTVALAALAGLSSAPLSAQVIASFDFDSDTVGTGAPAGFTLHFPTSGAVVGPAGGVGGSLSASGANGDVGSAVVGATNTLGASDAALFGTSGNKFLRIFDRDTGTGGTDTTNIYNTTALTNTSLSAFSFDFASTQHTGTTAGQNSALFVAFSFTSSFPSANSNSGTNNSAMRIQIANEGANGTSISASNVTGAGTQSPGLLAGSSSTFAFQRTTVNNLTMVSNDDAVSRTYYIGTTERILPAGKYDLWLNDTLISSVGGLSMRDSHTTLGTDNFTRFAFGTVNGTVSDWAIDNISIFTPSASPIPEPSAFAAVAGLGVLGAVALRRRRHIA